MNNEKSLLINSHPFNSLVQSQSADTLYAVRSMLAMLQSFYCTNHRDENEQDAILYTGMYWIFELIMDAIEFEELRVEKLKE